MSSEEIFLEQLSLLISSGDSASIEALVFDVGTLAMETGEFPESCFNGIIHALEDDRFRHIKNSWKLLRVCEYNWEELSESQRSSLLVALERIYNTFGDWMACFVISGILGEQYKDDRAFALLCRLKMKSDEGPRSFVPHGFEHIVTDTSDPGLARRARAELENMQSDKSEAVRREVGESLSRLARRQSQVDHKN